MRGQAKQMQNTLAQEEINVEKKGIKITIDGNLEIKSISIPEGLSGQNLENALKDAMNEGVKKTQRIMAQKMQEMGGLSGLGL